MKTNRIQVQVSIRIKRRANQEINAIVLRQALHYRATVGHDPRGIRIEGICWWNGEKRFPTDKAAYTGKDIDTALNAMFRLSQEPQFVKASEGYRRSFE